MRRALDFEIEGQRRRGRRGHGKSQVKEENIKSSLTRGGEQTNKNKRGRELSLCR